MGAPYTGSNEQLLGRTSMASVSARTIPDYVDGYGKVQRFSEVSHEPREVALAPVRLTSEQTGASKLLSDIGAALDACGVRDGATLSFHHHMRNGDHLLNLVLAEAGKRGLRDLTIAPSSIFPVHAPLVEHMR